MTKGRVLDQTDLFGQMPPDLLDQLRGRTELTKLKRNEYVCRQGDVADELYIVFSGRIAISIRASDERESVVAVLGPGALFGELPLFDGGVRSADARALGTVHLVTVKYQDVKRVLSERPEVLWAVVRILTRRLRATDESLTDAMFLDVTGRTAKRLLQISAGEDDFRMPLTQEELAGMVGASRERVNKAIATFVKLGWLDVEGRTRYRILDREQLEIRATP
jgi:CRP-like cAMP-binding protein